MTSAMASSSTLAETPSLSLLSSKQRQHVDVHLLVLIHGMWGNPSHLAEMERVFVEKYCDIPGSEEKDKDSEDGKRALEVLVAQTNRDASTYDGIDWGGERITEEIQDRIQKLEEGDKKRVTRFSVIGYSLGGLVARYVIGILHSRSFFDKITPVSFTTVATPHIGLPRYPSFISFLGSTLGPRLLSRTGEQFYGVDSWNGSKTGKSLLEIMSDDGMVFKQGLKLFEKVTFYANAVNDVTVPYVTAAVESYDPFLGHDKNGMKIIFDPDYEPLIKSFAASDSLDHQEPKPALFSKEWLASFKPRRPPLPPFLEKKFPYNILIYISLPVLIPTFMCMAIFRLSMESRASRARIRLLEADESASTTLTNMLRALEKEVDDVVADMMDDPSPSGAPSSSPSTSSDQQPKLTASQLRMIASINKLPRLKKVLVFIDPVRNSHATIVCRDVKRFEAHKRGAGVLKHLVDNFEV